MRITFVCHTAGLAGGIRVIATYARVLSDLGHEVFVLSGTRKPQSRLRKAWLRLRGRPEMIKNRAQSPLLDFLGDRHIRYDLDAPFDPSLPPDSDVVFATWWRTAEIVAKLAPSKGRKFYLLQGYEVFPPHDPARVVATYHLPLHKIAVSSWVRNVICAKHDVQFIDVVNNAVDIEQFAGVKRPKNAEFTVGFLYSAQSFKRIALALAALTKARGVMPNIRVVAFGASAPKEKLPLPEWVTFHQSPSQTNIPKLYQSCDVWLFPSEQEGFGLPILEAMACRTPVIATPAGAAPDLIDGTNGVLMPQDADAAAMCAEILKFAEMPEKQWQGYSDRAFETAKYNDWDSATKRLLAIINDRQDAEQPA